MSETKKRNIVICSLIGVIVLMGVAYAAFSTVLNVNGTANVTSKWDVKITSITGKNAVGTATDAAAPTFTNTTATFSTNLVSPGDSKTYDIVVTNNGTLPAKLSSITENKGTNPAIVYTASGLTQNQVIAAGATATYTVTVTYSNSVTSQPASTTSAFSATFNFVQG